MVIVETSFPRGGTVKPQAQTDIDFGARLENRKKPKRKPKKSDNVETAKEIKAVSAELLSHKTIQEGMLVMGSVKSIDPTFLKISLPGRIIGRVLVSSVSESYNKVMRKFVDGLESTDSFKPLTELFQVGQKVYVKVIEIANSDHGRLHVTLSLKPSDVHANFNHKSLRKGQLFNGAIGEVQDHGYVIESGVKNLRCFLPAEKIQRQLTVGQLVYMRIEKLTQAGAASTAVCNPITGGSLKIKDITDPNLDHLLPTSVVNFTISKILKDGLQGTIMNGLFTGYVNEHQLAEVMQVPDDYEANATVSARILYVMPLTKLVYLSLRTKPLAEEEEAQFKRGDIVDEATVHHIGTGGIILDLNGKGKGLISFKSIKTNYTGNYDQDEMLAKYKKNSKHKVRIMEYDEIDALYTCSDNVVVVNEKFYTLADLKPGDFVTGTIQGKEPNGGYFIRVGNVRGLIEKMFLASTGGNLQENAKIRCRVIWTNPDRNVVYLTNRNEYMSKTAKLLTEMSGVKINRIYTGTIVKDHDKCYIIRFFGNIKAILYKNQISGFMSAELASYHQGATLSLRIVSQQDGKIVVGLAEDVHKMGEICEAKITNIIQDGLEIAIEGGADQIKGLVPIRLLTDFPELAVGHLKTYNLEDELTVGCVIQSIYSVRDVENFKARPVKEWKDIKPGDQIKGFVKNVDNDIVEILLPILKYDKLVKVHLKMLLDHCVRDPNVMLVRDQVVFVKILSKENITRTLTVSAKLTDIWDCDLKATDQWFARYLSEVRHIRKKLKAQGRPIGSYKIGEKVSAKVVSCDPIDKDWSLELPHGVRGVIKSAISGNDSTLNAGKERDCVILWIDYSTEIVYLSHKPGDIQHITTGLELPKKYQNQVGINAKILLKMDDFLLCSMKKGQNPIIFIPARLHLNDFENTIAANMSAGEFCKLAFIHDSYPIAVTETTWKFWNRLGKRKAPKEPETKEERFVAKKAKLLQSDDKATTSIKKNYVSLSSNFDDENRDASSEVQSSLFFKDTGKNKKLRPMPPNPVVAVIEGDIENEASDSEDDTVEDDDAVGDVDSVDDNDGAVEDEIDDDAVDDEAEDDAVEDDDDGGDDSESDEPPKKKTLTDDETLRPFQRQKINTIQTNKKKPTEVQPLLPGASGFWSTNLDSLNQSTIQQSESSDDEDNSANDSKTASAKKKRKQTASEKFQVAREEEARLRQIEENYANPNMQPETADQFDRLVLTNPNNSMTWINYMVFHLQATEIDKARSVARKALKSISFREEQELINIWVALLNLELRYGTKESFNEILKESTLCNDPYKIYTRSLQILSDAKKIIELNELIPIVTKKFKDKPDIWKSAASAYFQVGLVNKAKQLLHKALAILPERDHINTIVTFANLNYKNDDKETAHTLLEQIVTSYPKRVDVWSQYVDMLIKDNEIESARRTLERSVVQKIPIKKMRTLFKKYLEFEEKYGNEENVHNVKEMAANYVKNEINS